MDETLVNMVIEDIVDDQGFRKFVKALNLNYVLTTS